jgi:hypothetical protein
LVQIPNKYAAYYLSISNVKTGKLKVLSNGARDFGSENQITYLIFANRSSRPGPMIVVI